MKVVHFTHNLIDGGGRAAYRLHKALLKEGIESLMLVSKGDSSDRSVIELPTVLHNFQIKKNEDSLISAINYYIALFGHKAYWKLILNRWKPLTLFNLNISLVGKGQILKHLHGAEIICLYSIQEFLSSSLIRDIYSSCRIPIVWTLMDIEPITGGCHFNNGCDRFMAKCGNCPQLPKRMENDISRRIWRQKSVDYSNIPITMVAVTTNSREQIAKSSLFRKNRIEKILLSVSESIYKKIDKSIAREALGLPKDKRIVLFGCFSLDDSRKGGDYLLEALMQLLHDSNLNGMKLGDEVVLVTMGRKGNFDASQVPAEWIHLGPVNDDRMVSLVFHACDVFVCPSIDDVGPMMINEAFMCGTRVVAFDSGVAPDLIDSAGAGYVVEHGDVNGLSDALSKCLSDVSYGEICQDVARLRKSCTPKFQANEYLSVFNSLLAEAKD